MLKFVKGDFFDFDADIRINTVNCVGVMGAGVALAFKKKYPEMFKDYVKQCKNNDIFPGRPTVWKKGDMFSKSIEIINFPTKNHWRNPSEYEYIEEGLKWLSNYLESKEKLTITLPALGCGHGGLDWEKVKTQIIKYLENTPHEILVFEPSSSKKAGKRNIITIEQLRELESLYVKLLKYKDKDYPIRLTRYTEKDLWILGNPNTDYDFTIITSTTPSENEVLIVNSLIEYCKTKKFSILFGGTAFDKKMALKSMDQGITTGIFLPSGIKKSADKMSNKDIGKLSVLSVGDPFTSFDKSEYLPSVLSRMFLSKSIVFTTNRLKWLKKQNKIIKKYHLKSYFIHYSDLSDEDYSNVLSIDSVALEQDFINLNPY